eukprot:c25437_g1_i2 orf=290-3490(+)
MGDQSASSPSKLAIHKKQQFKSGGCMPTLSQLFDRNRAFGNKSLVTRILPPDSRASSSPVSANIKNAATDEVHQAKQSRSSSSKQNPQRRKLSRTECGESLGTALDPCIPCKSISKLDSSRNCETPSNLRHLHELLCVQQEPFIRQSFLPHKKQPIRRQYLNTSFQIPSKTNKNTCQLEKSQNVRRIKLNDVRKSLSGQLTELEQAETARQQPGLTNTNVAPSPSRLELPQKLISSPTFSPARMSSPLGSSIQSPGKGTALLMEVAIKLLEPNAGTRKCLPTVRSLVLEMDDERGSTEQNHRKKRFKEDFTNGSWAKKPAFWVQRRRKEEHKSYTSPIYQGAETNTILEDFEEGVKLPQNKQAGQQDKDSGSQSRVFPDDRTTCPSEDLAGQSQEEQDRNALGWQKGGIFKPSRRLFGSSKLKKDGQNRIECHPSRLLSFFLQRKIPSEPSSGGHTSDLSTNSTGQQKNKRLFPNVASVVGKSLGRRQEMRHPSFREDNRTNISNAGPWMNVPDSETMVEGTWKQEATEPWILGNTFESIAQKQDQEHSFASDWKVNEHFGTRDVLKNDCYDYAVYFHNKEYEEELTKGAGRLEMTEHRQEQCEGTTSEEGLIPPFKTNQEVSMSTSTSDCERLEEVFLSIDNVEAEMEEETSMVEYSCPLVRENGANYQPGVLKSYPMHCPIISLSRSGPLKLCNFSWWDKDIADEQAVKNVTSVEAFCSSDLTFSQDSQEATIEQYAVSPPHLTKVFKEHTADLATATKALVSPGSACVYEHQWDSPVSVLEPLLEEDSLCLEKSLASFEDAKQQLLWKLERYELLAQMDLAMLEEYIREEDALERQDEDVSRDLDLEKTQNGDRIDGIFSFPLNNYSSHLSESWTEKESFRQNNGGKVNEDIEIDGQWKPDELAITPDWASYNLPLHADLYSDKGTEEALDCHWKEAKVQEPKSPISSGKTDILQRFQEGKRQACKYFSNCVNEVFQPAEMPVGHVDFSVENCYARQLVRAMQEPILSWESEMVASLVQKDIGSGKSNWLEFSNDVEEVGEEIESNIFGLLLHEFVAELTEAF